MHYRLTGLLILLPAAIFSQNFEEQIDGIQVTQDGRPLQLPWNGGLNTASVGMGDLDGDGDIDLLFTGADDRRLQYYRNDGEGEGGTFELANPALNDIRLNGNDNRLALHDFDRDGDLDLFAGENVGTLNYFRNEGGTAQPDFSFVTAFFDSINVGFVSAPTFGDLNGDGRMDLLVGNIQDGLFYFTRTTGGERAFAFVDTLRDASGSLIKPDGQFFVPTLVDVDADSDLDLFVGSSRQGLSFYRNTGSASAPQFAEETTPFLPDIDRSFVTPTFADIDNDSDFDLFFASNHGFVSFFRNDGSPTTPNFIVFSSQLSLAFLDFGFFSTPSLVDIDADDDLDLISGATGGNLVFLHNTGSATMPRFEWVTSQYQSIQIPGGSIPTWGDLDNDGDPDLLSGALLSGRTRVQYYQNIGSAENAVLDSIGALVDTAGTEIDGRRAEVGDIDGDDDLDLLVTRVLPFGLNAMFLYENVGTASAMAFSQPSDTLRDANGNAVLHFDMFFRLVDFDFNGTLDLLIGDSNGRIILYANVGAPGTFSFVLAEDFLSEITTGVNNRNAPFAADIDGDADLDLFTGRFQGGLFFFRQVEETTSVAPAPRSIKTFTLAQNYPNPFNPKTTIHYTLEQATRVELRIYNARGQKIRTLLDSWQAPGPYRMAWDGTDDSGKPVASGVYFYRLRTGTSSQTKKMLLLQ